MSFFELKTRIILDKRHLKNFSVYGKPFDGYLWG